jgi:hypothetical protein
MSSVGTALATAPRRRKNPRMREGFAMPEIPQRTRRGVPLIATAARNAGKVT